LIDKDVNLPVLFFLLDNIGLRYIMNLREDK
jgi:hypothetical protein